MVHLYIYIYIYIYSSEENIDVIMQLSSILIYRNVEIHDRNGAVNNLFSMAKNTLGFHPKAIVSLFKSQCSTKNIYFLIIQSFILLLLCLKGNQYSVARKMLKVQNVNSLLSNEIIQACNTYKCHPSLHY